ncbi:MAG: hypothetical protein QF464_00480 [Myxococcota bacterium]|jgi:hypothetical protein|nr:hypothetical protein [Myxococcota bacterium]
MISYAPDDWSRLLSAVGCDLPGAWLAIREFAERAHAVDWRAPNAPSERPFSRDTLFDGAAGDVAIVHWRPGAMTPSHTLHEERLFHCILVGELHQRLYGDGTGYQEQWGEFRCRAPDAILCGAEQRFSLYTPTGTVTLAVRARFQKPPVLEDTDPARPAMTDEA